MRSRRVMVLLLVLATACMGEPGGGGVNIPGPSSTLGPLSTTTSSAPTTTTTASTTTTTTTVPVFRLSGRVTGPGGTPVARARVSIGDIAARTGPDGRFAIETTEEGTLKVTKRGWSSTEHVWKGAAAHYEVEMKPKIIRGLRVAPETAASDAAFEELLGLADETAVNAFVFDTKRESGEVLYDTAVEEAHDIGAVKPMYDPVARIAQAHDHRLYTVTRVAAFEDDIRSSAVPDELLAGTWLDPGSPSARAYVLDLAAEACRLGFDEIQFDYVRYPAGRTAELTGQRDMTQKQRLGVVSGFLAEARAMLHPMGCAVSAAIFGIVVSMPDDQGLGQRPEEVSAQVDAISPMIYPSHYSEGWLGFPNPNDHPYEVTADAIEDAATRMRDGSTLRPYLQAFWWTNEQIRQSIQAAEDAGVGWILWNILSQYDRSALPSDEELRG